jgi:hypothetical protein
MKIWAHPLIHTVFGWRVCDRPTVIFGISLEIEGKVSGLEV